jgi:biofilm protein TabA
VQGRKEEHVVIVDRIENHLIYAPLGARIAEGLKFLARLTAGDFLEHTIELDGRDLYAMFQAYTTEPADGRHYEAHRDYIDIQYILSGEEIIKVANVGTLETETLHDADRDVAFYRQGPGTDVRLTSGDFALLFPHDAHLPKTGLSQPSPVQKVVVKVRR